MQDVLAGEADRAEHLMRDRRALRRRFGAADFRGGDFQKYRLVERACFGERIGGGARGGERGGGFAGELREVLLHRLEFADLALEGDALVGVGDAHL